MKKFYRILLSCISVLAAFSCDKGDGPALVDISGEWRLVSVNGESAGEVLGDEHLDIFLSLSENGGFEIFQRLLGSSTFVRYYGSWAVHGTVASGAYSDGTPWNASYEVSLSDGGQTLVMTSGMEQCIYSRAEILDSIREGAVDYTMTKSIENQQKPLL